MAHAPHPPIVRYAVRAPRAGWELSDETMPESVIHDEAVTLLRALLTVWASGKGRVVRNLAVRWDESQPRVGVDPDVAVLMPAPSEGTDLKSVRTWVDGHTPPLLAIEVVSESDPRKDYVVAPDKYAASGTKELWIFDPLLCGPISQGGPFRIQIWRREDEAFTRVYAGDGPAYSPTIDAHLVVIDDGKKLRIARDAAATEFWLTAEEAERAAKEAERAAKEAERAAKDRALERVAALEEELRRRGT
jgi:Uma2 family endonuclease